MSWSSPRIVGVAWVTVCILALGLRAGNGGEVADDSDPLPEIGLSYFEQLVDATSPIEHLHYEAPPADLVPVLAVAFELPPLPELPPKPKPTPPASTPELPPEPELIPPPPPNKLRPAKEAEKPATQKADTQNVDPEKATAEQPAAETPEAEKPDPAEKAEAEAAPETPPAEPPKAEDKPPAEEKTQEEPEPEVEEISYGVFDQIPWGKYYHIDYWLGESKWAKSVELGLNGQTGNTESTSLRVGAKVRRDGPHTIFTADIRHLRTSNKEGLTQNNAFINHKLEWPLKIYESWSLFEKTDIEYDAFKAFDMRLVFNGGLSYKPLKTDRSEWTLSAGTGFSQEYGIPTEDIVPEATLGTQLSHKVTDKQSFDIKFDYYPAFEIDDGYRHVTDASYKIALDEGLSLKISAINRYDSTPNGRLPNDLDYAVLLLYQF